MAGDSQPKCSYCRQSHSSSSCTVATDVAQRKGILKPAGRCFVCLRRHYLSRDCRSSTKCTRCNGRHHTSICNSHAGPQGKGRQQGSDSQNRVSAEQNTLTHPQHPQAPQPLTSQQLQPPQSQQPQTGVVGQQGTSTTTTQLYCVNTQVPVLLQTAMAYMHQLNDPRCGMTVRLMLDGGSQRSYITQRVRVAARVCWTGTD